MAVSHMLSVRIGSSLGVDLGIQGLQIVLNFVGSSTDQELAAGRHRQQASSGRCTRAMRSSCA